MPLHMVVHKLKTSIEQFSAAMESEDVPKLAKVMVAGETPVKCLKSWNLLPYGNTDTFICLWDAKKVDNISASLGSKCWNC